MKRSLAEILEELHAYEDATDILHHAFDRMSEERPWWSHLPVLYLFWFHRWVTCLNASKYTLDRAGYLLGEL